MLHLVTLLDGQAYAIEAARISEVAPLVRMQPGLGAAQLATFRHRGRMAPAVDLSRLLLGRPFQSRLSTRILATPHGEGGGIVGVVAEHLTQTQQIDTDAWRPARTPGDPPWLGPVAMTQAGPVRRLELDALLDAALAEPGPAA